MGRFPDVINSERQLIAYETEDACYFLSAEEYLEIGYGTEIGDDFRSKKQVYIFAEHLIVSGRFRANQVLISAASIEGINDPVIDISREEGDKHTKGLQLFVEILEPQKISFHVWASSSDLDQVTIAGLRFTADIISRLTSGYGSENLAEKLAVLHDIGAAVSERFLPTVAGAVYECYKDYDPEADPLPPPEEKGLPAALEVYLQYLANAGEMLRGKEKTEMLREINACFEAISDEIYRMDAMYEYCRLERLIYVADDPKKKKAGKDCIHTYSEAAEAYEKAGFPCLHPLQCMMRLNRAKTYYAMNTLAGRINAKGDTGLKCAADIFCLLARRTEPALKKNAFSSILDRTRAIGIDAYAEKLESVYYEAMKFGGMIGQSLDYFGNTAYKVPNLSYSLYKDQAETMLNHLKEIELSCHICVDETKNNQQKMEALIKARQAAEQVRSQSKKEREAYEQELTILEKKIGDLDRLAQSGKGKLKQALETLESAIQNRFGCSAEDILGAVSMIGFAPSSKLLIGSQIADLANKSFQTAVTSQGLHISKEYLVNKVSKVSGKLQAVLNSYHERADHTLEPDDPGAEKLLVQYDDLTQVMDDLHGIAQEEMDQVRTLLDGYVNNILLRNNAIMEYNYVIMGISVLNTQMLNSKREVDECNLSALRIMDHDLVAAAAFLQNACQRCKTKVMRIIYQELRAFRFRALSGIENIAADNFFDNEPCRITSDVLRSFHLDILDAYTKALNNRKSRMQAFPRASQSKGLCYHFPQAVREKLLEEIKSAKEGDIHIEFHIPVPEQNTDFQENCFARLGNVRLRRVKPVICGIRLLPSSTPEHLVQIDLQHNGSEYIYDAEADKQYLFVHDPLLIRYSYYFEDESRVVLDGDMQDKYEREDAFANFGPFTIWTLSIDKNLRKYLDFSQVSDVYLSFYGIAMPY
ncbi:hypothetical protein [Bacteroides sp.]|uniref:hypothetical protein n=1 Tax=Bacteroides sp. TaxID=29523 RepID=UPI002621C78E|nr:hypothetical protein [Bacteroides sp.]MDD3040808.1 hypothetical protein [Bacteroides sp.]